MEPQVVAAIIAVCGVILTVIATVLVQVSGRRATSRDTQQALDEQRKQLDRTLAEKRTRTLNERFATAAGQLGSDKPPEVRLAEVYAMAGLADNWQENQKNQQTCVDVLCAWCMGVTQPGTMVSRMTKQPVKIRNQKRIKWIFRTRLACPGEDCEVRS
jgi:hypothetical protein